MECQRYNITAQSVSKCLFFASNLETNNSKMAKTGAGKKHFKFCKTVKNNNSLPAQTPAWLPPHLTPKIENLPENSPGDVDCSLADYNFITINSPTTGVDDIELLSCVLDSVNVSNSLYGRNSHASLCPSSVPKSIDYGSTSKSDSSHAKEDRNQSQTSKSKATVCRPVGSEDPQPANNNPKTVYLVTYSQADVVKVPDHERFAEIVSNAFQSPKDNTPLVQK